MTSDEPPAATDAIPTAAGAAATRPSGWDAGRLLSLATLGLVVAALIVAIGALRGTGADGAGQGGAAALEAGIKADRYQAVYLDNERVYFGKLRAVEGQWFVLRDAFFIRTTKAADGKQAGSEVARITEEVADPQQDLLLPADSIDMVQNLRANSSVAAAIDDVVK